MAVAMVSKRSAMETTMSGFRSSNTVASSDRPEAGRFGGCHEVLALDDHVDAAIDVEALASMTLSAAP